MKNIITYTLLLGCLVLSLGCSTPKEQVKIDTQETVKDSTTKELVKDSATKELVSVQDFKDYYNIEETDIPDDYIESFIERRELTLENIGKLNYDVMLQKLYERNIVYENSIYELTSGTEVDNIDFNNLTHIIIQNGINKYGNDTREYELIVIDIVDNSIYFNGDDTNYKSTVDIITVNSEWIEKRYTELISILTSDDYTYNENNCILDFNIQLVSTSGDTVTYSGTITDEGSNLYKWYLALTEGE